MLRRTATRGEAIQAALFGTFIALNLYGLNRGESARLWMFWVPVVVILAAIEIAPLLKRRPWLFYLLIAAQFMTLVLTYKFQDLKM